MAMIFVVMANVKTIKPAARTIARLEAKVMITHKIRIMGIVALLVAAITLAGCTEADRVSHNVSKQADNFNVMRHVMVINTRTDTPLLEVVGRLSIQTSNGDVDIIIEVEPGVYKKHFVSMNEYTVYVVEDINGAQVSQYHYEINVLPKAFQLFSVTFDE